MNEGVLAIMLIFGLPIVAILTSHHRRIVEMNLKARHSGDDTVLAELRKVRQEVEELRDTTTRFDLSFDTAIQRLESRVEHLERNAAVTGASAVNQGVR